MKKVSFLFLLLSFSILYGCKTQGKADSTLRTLKVLQGDIQVFSIDSPVPESITVSLPHRVDAVHPVKVIATPKNDKSDVEFVNDGAKTREKVFSDFYENVSIKVTDAGSTTTYNVEFFQPSLLPQDDSTLKRLVIKQGSENLKVFTSPVQERVYQRLKASVDANNSITIEATTQKVDAQVFFDGETESKKTKTYTSFVEKVLIEVKFGTYSTKYEINLKNAKIPEPESYTIKCNVVDSMGGTNVENAKIQVYEKGQSTLAEEKTTDVDGNAYFTLSANKYYNFVLSKKGMAASRVENMYIKQGQKEFLSIVMRKWAVGAARISPEISKVEVGKSGSFTDIPEVYDLDFATLDDETKLRITVKSKSGEIIPEKIGDENHFGFLVNIDGTTTMKSDEVMTPESEKENGKTINIDASGVVTQIFSLNLNQLSCNNGEHILYFIIYDAAGNRLIHRVRLNVKNSKLKENEDRALSFNIFEAKSERYYRTLNIFGMPEEAGSTTSNIVEFKFKIAPLVYIDKVDVLRREYQVGNIQDGWKIVSTRCYPKNFSGGKTRTVTVHDDSGEVEEGKIYQYKLEAYTQRGKVVSPVATLRMMEAFNIQLTSPRHREVIQKSTIKNRNFSFKLGNDILWNKEKADYFLFDILIVKDEVAGRGSEQDKGVCFASKMKYDFRESGEKILAVGIPNSTESRVSYKTYKSVGGKQHSVTDLIRYSDGTITILNNFFAERKFNLAKISLAESLEVPGMYYWDIQNFGVDPLALADSYGFDDAGASFVKEYPYLDAKTGNALNGERCSTSSSFCNLKRVGGAINGRALFILK